MAEWFKAAVLKTVERKFRGFESYSLRQQPVDSEQGTADSKHFIGFAPCNS